jgi:2-methylcitrate dehydratase PrpD
VLEVLAASVDRAALGLGWPQGHRWELELNTIKTYPCGVVAHPAMDAAIIAHARLAQPARITGVTLRCNPLVPELMGREQPADGLGSRFSARHGVAVGLLYGRAGLAEFSDAAPGPAGVPAVEVAVEHTRGSAALPLTDDEVLAKVRALFGPVLGEAAADRARDAIDKLPGATDTSELLAALRPEQRPEGRTRFPLASQARWPARTARETRPAQESGQGVMTSTEEILALAAGLRSATTTAADGAAVAQAAGVTDADLAAFGEAAALGAGSEAARALGAIRPGPASAAPSGDPAWTAWLTAAAATVTASGAGGNPEGTETGPVHPAWLAVFAAGTALADGPGAVPAGVTVRSAVAAGMSAAAIVESGLADWGGWSPGTVAGTVGASVTAGLLLELTGAQLRSAVGIAATQASGLAAAEATPAVALQAGKAAFNGVEAALLARAGLTAPAEPLDGRRGLFALFG